MKKILITITISIAGIFVITTDCLEHYAFFHVEMAECTGKSGSGNHKMCPVIKCEGVCINRNEAKTDCNYLDVRVNEASLQESFVQDTKSTIVFFWHYTLKAFLFTIYAILLISLFSIVVFAIHSTLPFNGIREIFRELRNIFSSNE